MFHEPERRVDKYQRRTVMGEMSERKSSERERQMLASLVDSTRDFVALAAPDGRLTYLNEPATRGQSPARAGTPFRSG